MFQLSGFYYKDPPSTAVEAWQASRPARPPEIGQSGSQGAP